jgi:hypothetical protein
LNRFINQFSPRLSLHYKAVTQNYESVVRGANQLSRKGEYRHVV